MRGSRPSVSQGNTCSKQPMGMRLVEVPGLLLDHDTLENNGMGRSGSQKVQQTIQNLKQQASDPYFLKKINDIQQSLFSSVASVDDIMNNTNNTNNGLSYGRPYPSHSVLIPSGSEMGSAQARYMGQILHAHEQFGRVDYAMNEGIRFDEIFHNCDMDLKKINDDLERFIRQYPPCSFIDKFKGPFFLYPWQDPVIWNITLAVKDKEKELALILGDIPVYTQLHQLRLEKLRKLTRFRIELERLMEQLANEYRKPCFTTMVIERARTPPKYEKPFKVISFNVYWDFLLRFFKNCRTLRIVYGIYNRGQPQITPRFVMAKVITQHEVYENGPVYLEYTGEFNGHHLIKDLVIDPDHILVFEIQGSPQSKSVFYRPEDFDIYSGSGTGYPLWRDREDNDALDLDLGITVAPEECLAWGVIDLFNQKGELNRGNFKQPLYLPPAAPNVDLHRFPDCVTRIPLTHLFMRIESYYTTDTDRMKSGQPPTVSIEAIHTSSSNSTNTMGPRDENSYYLPDVHNFNAEMCKDLRKMTEADRNYKCNGIHLYIHHVEGINPERHVRVGYLLQFGKFVVKQNGGMFCFFATKGINPFNLLGLKKLKKSTKEKEVAPDSIPFDDGIQWSKNFYRMVSHYWEIGLMRNLNVVLLYLQLKPGVRPTMASTINKSMLEEEYDLLGYSVFKLVDDKGRVNYGRYTLPLYDGPPFVEDILETDKNSGLITFTVEQFGKPVPEIHIPIKDKIKAAFGDLVKSTPQAAQQLKASSPAHGGQAMQQAMSSSIASMLNKSTPLTALKGTPTNKQGQEYRVPSPLGETRVTPGGKLSPAPQAYIKPNAQGNQPTNMDTQPLSTLGVPSPRPKGPKVLTAQQTMTPATKTPDKYNTTGNPVTPSTKANTIGTSNFKPSSSKGKSSSLPRKVSKNGEPVRQDSAKSPKITIGSFKEPKAEPKTPTSSRSKTPKSRAGTRKVKFKQ